MSSTVSPPQATEATSPLSVPSNVPSAPSSPSNSREDGEVNDSLSVADDTEPAISLGSIDTGLPEDHEGDASWRSWRTRYSDETDISNKSTGSKASAVSRQSAESQVSFSSARTFASDSMGSQDIEVITSPDASLRIHPYDEKSHPYNIGDSNHRRSDSASSNSALPSSRYAYPDSYSEGNPYAYPTTSTPSDACKREDNVLLASAPPASTTPASESTATEGTDDFSSNSAHVPITAPLPPSTAPTKPSVALRRRLNASIPIINPIDRSVVRTPAMQAKEYALLTVEEEPSEPGDQTVVPSPLPMPTDPDARELHGSAVAPSSDYRPDMDATQSEESAQVVYYAKPPIDLTDLMAASQARRATAAAEQDGPGGSVSSTPSVTASQTAFKSPNVYINGLPPYYPEDELLALVSPYGVVRSVRSFTRHVDVAPSAGPGTFSGLRGFDDGLTVGGKKASGYGFVLFETVEEAERCIEGLKKYRNLHPSFSKQIHKIPGTPYTAMQLQSEGDLRADDQDGEAGASDAGDPDCFKARMERLEDKSSTNLYIEGLPLSIDGPLLSALVSPYQIKSSRFFQTKLSHPPRIIAFVRLETRAAAEEIIDRLHGRMVRGWNDAGSRISVRFADTTEQRELRRNERQSRSGQGVIEPTASKLTIAQAALLNLRGRELKTHGQGVSPSMTMSTLSGSPTLASLASFGSSRKIGQLASDSFNHMNDNALRSLPPSMPSPAFAADVVNGSRYLGGGYDTQDVDHQQGHFRNSRSRFGDSLSLTSPRALGMAVDEALVGRYPVIGCGLRPESSTAPMVGNEVNSGLGGLGMGLRGMGIGLPNRQGRLQAFNGYTPAEELLLQAHNTGVRTRSQQSQGRNFVRPQQRGARSQAGRGLGDDSGGRGRLGSVSTLRSLNTGKGGGVSEDDFHNNYRQAGRPLNDDIMPTSKPPSGTASPVMPYDFARQQQAQTSQTHVRSTTVPHPNRMVAATRHQQHSSISNLHSTTASINNNLPSNDFRASQSTNSAIKYTNIDTGNHDTSGTSKHTNIPSSLQLSKLNTSPPNSLANRQHHRSSTSSDLYKLDNGLRNHGTFKKASRSGRMDSTDQEAPTLLSPTLTCGSQTPSTLSPATPYFGSFTSSEGLQNQGKPGLHGGPVEVKGAMNDRT